MYLRVGRANWLEGGQLEIRRTAEGSRRGHSHSLIEKDILGEKGPPNGACRKRAKLGKALGGGAKIDRVEGIRGSRPGEVGNDQCSPRGMVRSEDIIRLDHQSNA